MFGGYREEMEEEGEIEEEEDEEDFWSFIPFNMLFITILL